MEYKILKNNEDIEKAYKLRNEVFVLEQNVPIELELDELDNSETTLHIGIFQRDKIIAVGRILDLGSNTVHIGRIAVDKKYRNRGIGRFLIMIIEDILKNNQKGKVVIKLDAQLSVVDFYKKLDYLIEDDNIFIDAGIEHIKMYKEIG